MLFLFAISVWIAAAGFLVMLVAAFVVYRSLGQLGRDQLRQLQDEGGFSVAALLGRLAERFRGP
jgi:hypothetical protein